MLKKRKAKKGNDLRLLKGNKLYEFLKDKEEFGLFIKGIKHMLKNKELFKRTGSWDPEFYDTHVYGYNNGETWACLKQELNINNVTDFFIKLENDDQAIANSFDWNQIIILQKGESNSDLWSKIANLSVKWERHVKKEKYNKKL